MAEPNVRFSGSPKLDFFSTVNRMSLENYEITNSNFEGDNHISNIKKIYIEVYFSDNNTSFPENHDIFFDILSDETEGNNSDIFQSLNTTETMWNLNGSLSATYENKYLGLKLYAEEASGTFLGSAISDNPLVNLGNDPPHTLRDTYTCTFTNWYSDEDFSTPWDGNVRGIYCLLKGTQILTPEGSKPIESLSKGDEIFNSSKKVKKIKSILYQKVKVDKSKKNRDKYKDKYQLKGDSGLILSGGHMVKLDDGYHLPINSDRFENVQEDQGENEYYHLELDEYDYFIANGVEVESLCREDLEKLGYYKERGINFSDLVK